GSSRAGPRAREARAAAARVLRRHVVAPPDRDHRGRVRSLPGVVRRLGGVQRRQLRLGHDVPARARDDRQLHADPDELRPGPGHAELRRLALPAVAAKHDSRRRRHRARHRHPRLARRVRVQPLPLPRAADGDARAAPDPDVPAAAAHRRDLPDRPQRRRDLPVHAAEHVQRVDPRLSRRGVGGERVAPERLLRHDPGRAGRIGARRRSDGRPDLLGRRDAARRAGARRRRPDLVHLDAERVRDRERDHADAGPPHARGRHERLYRPEVRPAVGPVRRRHADRRDPRGCTLHVAPEVARRRVDAGRRQGMTTTELARGSGLDAAHHDGSELYVVDRPDTLGGKATLRVRVPTGAADRVLLRCTIDGEPRTIKAKVDSEADGETWWRADLPLENPVVRYRWLLAGGETGYAWLNARGLSPREVSGADDYALALHDGAPAWHASSVVYEIFPDRFARSGAHYDPPQWAVPRDWDALPEGRGKNTSAEWFGGDLAGIEQHLDHVAGIGANVLYLTPFFPAGSTHRYDASSFDRVDPLLGGDEALASLLRAARVRGMRILGDLTLNHIGVTHEWFEHAVANERAPERDFFYFDSSLPHGYAAWLDVRTLPKLDWRSEE